MSIPPGQDTFEVEVRLPMSWELREIRGRAGVGVIAALAALGWAFFCVGCKTKAPKQDPVPQITPEQRRQISNADTPTYFILLQSHSRVSALICAISVSTSSIPLSCITVRLDLILFLISISCTCIRSLSFTGNPPQN